MIIATTINCCLMIFSLQAQEYYWVGGPGNWDDISHWSKVSGDIDAPVGNIPNEDGIVIFDDNSGLQPNDDVTIPPGIYALRDLYMIGDTPFDLVFNGTSSSSTVEMYVFGSIEIEQQHDLIYNGSEFDNKWILDGNATHNIDIADNDLYHVELKNQQGTFNLQSTFTASERIRMYGGTWNMNGKSVHTAYLLFNDGSGSGGSQLDKIVTTGGASIYSEEWSSVLTYGSLMISGDHDIYVSKFRGHPAIPNQNPSILDNIHLLEFSDTPSGSGPIEHNNFECTNCIIDKIIIEDTGQSQLATPFMVLEEISVSEIGLEVRFNSGNGRINEVTIEGAIYLPQVNECDNRVSLTAAYTDFVTVNRSLTNMLVEDAIITDLQASGPVDFEIANSVLQGASTGWIDVSPPLTIEYIWDGPGDGLFGNWNDPNNWTTNNGPTGCIPSITDDVHFLGSSLRNVRIFGSNNAECRNFFWNNSFPSKLLLDVPMGQSTALLVSGDFYIKKNSIVSSINNGEIVFSSSTSNSITTEGVQLPNIRFISTPGTWTLIDALLCEDLRFGAGTLNTNGQDVTADYWVSIDDYPKNYLFSDSDILVNGEMALSLPTVDGVSVNAGSSTITCKKLRCKNLGLHDIKFINTSPITLDFVSYSFNSLRLSGSSPVTTTQDLTLNTLIFESANSTLVLDNAKTLTVNEQIVSLTSSIGRGRLISDVSGTMADVDKSLGNLCVFGYVEYTDINSLVDGVFHSPSGIDAGNNANIEFDDGLDAANLYWIKGNGGIWETPANWSRLSGGCPSVKDPAVMDTLIFDSNSFYISPVTVDVTTSPTANIVRVESTENMILDIGSKLFPDAIIVDGGYLNVVGNTLDIAQQLVVQNSGFMTTDVSNGKTPILQSDSGALVVRSGSTFKVE